MMIFLMSQLALFNAVINATIRRLTVKILAALIIAFLCAFGCTTESDQMNVSKIEAKIKDELHPGKTTCTQIEIFLGNSNWGGSFDRFNRRYQITIRGEGENYKAISIYLYVDKECVFQRSEVKETYTMP